MRIGILGATGQAGREISGALLKAGFADVVLIGRDATKLGRLQSQLAEPASQAPEIAIADAGDRQALIAAFGNLDMVVIAVGSADHLPSIIDAALDSRTDCLDILLCSAEKRRLLEACRGRIEALGLIYITDGGYHPGVPAALVRYAEMRCPGLHTAEVYGAFGVNWRERIMSLEASCDFVRELGVMDMGRLQGGNWVSDWRGMRSFDFGDGRGARACVPMGMDEMRELPYIVPTLRNAGFFIAGFGRVMDWIVMPVSLLMLKLFPRAITRVARFFVWGVRTFGGRQDWACLQLARHSQHEGIRIRLTCPSAYELTAFPVIACLRQYVEQPRKPGLHRQALFVAPGRFMADLKQAGVHLAEVKTGP
ncbi:MAG: hypothetical protein CGU28_14025 [Candidatus Dactylopiibacterium carminicum]|uniref:NAD(P)-binding domain-containing protein n=1 Tax=Candidatus Dactylopiibacterium carminicum TaxID=857335 RepID=A0A272ET82_9RHOO|nr:NAD(P)H-binding protein [Candidatus Dactylopiibacterium carminicum]KAF7599320.1 hypothetical protein BGI27_08570 [Candidatus Dactylopiibacterium carminicum]PAS93311.1 MAG: hypothetical protein CGU29_08220 [Candidatus Dactylopiibacterium carminicum]PAS94333.1 MAG: hypothetical protein CGU28_14025 [Candidatus Dactylopiibacterium carminicum]PAS99323.1 MAG: hypothetical protein BSR46_08600 [Candidatus Dactylopiibacterium carminicum]